MDTKNSVLLLRGRTKFLVSIDVINNNRIDAKYCQMAFRSVPTHLEGITIWNPWLNKSNANLEDSACTVRVLLFFPIWLKKGRSYEVYICNKLIFFDNQAMKIPLIWPVLVRWSSRLKYNLSRREAVGIRLDSLVFKACIMFLLEPNLWQTFCKIWFRWKRRLKKIYFVRK